MGWAAADESVKGDCEIQLSHTRSAMYRLKKRIEKISHDEKRASLLKAAELAWKELDNIEMHLNR